MQDYNINVNYNPSNQYKQTDIRKVKTSNQKKTLAGRKQRTPMRGVQKAVGGGLAVASRINNYVGALTENVVQQRNRQTLITFAGMGVYALSNPITATIGAAVYIGDKVVNYQVKQYKRNLSADFMTKLSGGVYTAKG